METNGIVCYMRNLFVTFTNSLSLPAALSCNITKAMTAVMVFRNPERIPHTDGAEDTA